MEGWNKDHKNNFSPLNMEKNVISLQNFFNTASSGVLLFFCCGTQVCPPTGHGETHQQDGRTQIPETNKY